MLVGDQNGRERLRVLAERLHALEGFAAGDAGIDQNLGARARDECTISPAAARQHRDRHTHAGSIRARPVEPGVTSWLSYTLGLPASGSRHPASGFGSPSAGNQND